MKNLFIKTYLKVNQVIVIGKETHEMHCTQMTNVKNYPL